MKRSRNEHGAAYVELALVLSLLVTIGTPIFGKIWPKIEAVNASTEGYETMQGFANPLVYMTASGGNQGLVGTRNPFMYTEVASLARLDESGDIRLNLDDAGSILDTFEARAAKNAGKDETYCFFVISAEDSGLGAEFISAGSNYSPCGIKPPAQMLSSITAPNYQRRIYLGMMLKPDPNLTGAKLVFALYPLFQHGYDKLTTSSPKTNVVNAF